MFTKLRMKEEKGFTLIELLIVVAIIGILAAIAIPQFGAYRKRGYNAAAQSDLRGIRTAEEALATDYSDYGTSQIATAALNTTQGADGEETTGIGLYLLGGKTSTVTAYLTLSPNVKACIKGDGTANGTAHSYWNAVTTHTSGDRFFGADSEPSGLFTAGRAAVAYNNGWVKSATPTATSGVDFTATIAAGQGGAAATASPNGTWAAAQ